MGNNQLYNLWFILCCLVLTSCGKTQPKETDNTDNVKKVYSLDTTLKEVTFLPDSTVNNILILNNAESSKRFYSEISSEKVIIFLRESPVLGFTNKDANEYLLLYQYEGGVKDAFSCLIRIKGKSYKKNENKIIYRITDYSNSNFLKNYNVPAYFLECTLKDNKIVKIKYGFDYP